MTLAFSFRLSLVILNIVAIAAIFGVIYWRVMSVRRNPERSPANFTPFLRDEDLEGRRLERVLGWAMVMASVMLVALVVYFLLEPVRSDAARKDFDEDSIERGAVLFANKSSEHYEAEFSLLCADCHGTAGTGGVATFVLQPEADKCQKKANQKNPDVPECLPKQVQWQAPDLTLAALRYSRAQLIEIVTYGRPGTPMPAWGVASGKGAKNEQSIEDLVNYIESIAVTPEKAKEDAAKAVDDYRQKAEDLVLTAGDTPTGTQARLEEAQADLAAAQANPDTSAAELATLQEAVETATGENEKAIAYRDEVRGLSEAAVLFRLNCARCHTKGWSYYVTEPERTDLPEIPEQGSGAYGPALNGGNVLLQFPGQTGEDQQYLWVSKGAKRNEQYGIRGISSGRMPHFGMVLTKEQIEAIIRYERALSGEANEEST